MKPPFHQASARKDDDISPALNQNSETPTPDDFNLMEAIAQGDQQAMRMLVHRWQGPLINFFYRSLHCEMTAEDLTQVVFVKICRSASRYRPDAKFSTFLFHIARRVLINEFRRQSRKPLDSVDSSELTNHSAPDSALPLMEIEEALESALATLPENQRTAILLLKQQGLSYEEIAQIMEAPTTSIKTWIHRARESLKEQLRDFYEKR